ncbi:MAG TPA: ATP-binding protein, partial [Candidatus Nitrosotalea sp.]|nr:ATP-binding protein [Candidatus Nitrosotalea sp.]
MAIFELVKNSYDACSKKVDIVFHKIKKSSKYESKIYIIDHGKGMSRDDIENKWLFVGFSDKKITLDNVKKYEQKSKTKGRIFAAGAKGIGRFSADRLGSKLDMYTKKENESTFHHLHIDWDKFENQNDEFQNIKALYSTVGDTPHEIHSKIKNGTVLIISELNDGWDKKKLLRLKRHLQRLVNPSTQEEQDFKIHLIADEYVNEDALEKNEHDKVNGQIRNIVFEKLGIKTTNIVYSIKDGKAVTELKDKGRTLFKATEINEYKKLDNVNIWIFYLNVEAKSAFTKNMGTEPKNYGSIFVYKNGFRIHPYGDVGDDWLSLDRRKTQGYKRFLGNRDVIGRVEIYGPQLEFIEASSRDNGFIMNDAVEQLKNAFMDAHRRLERYVVEGIDWDSLDEEQKPKDPAKMDISGAITEILGQVKDPQKNIQFNTQEVLAIIKERQQENMPEIIHNIESLKKIIPPKARKYVDSQLTRMRKITRTLSSEKNEIQKRLDVKIRESLFLSKAISSDKDVILNLNHAIKIASQTIKSHIYEINKKIKAGDGMGLITPLLDKISLENQKVQVIAEIVTNARFNLKVNWITEDLVRYVKEYLETILPKTSEGLKVKYRDADIQFETKFRPIDL